jgi:hypothetical protein
LISSEHNPISQLYYLLRGGSLETKFK